MGFGVSIILLALQIQSQFRFRNEAINIPSPQKEKTGGEDAWFDSERVLAVFDGVGGWNR